MAASAVSAGRTGEREGRPGRLRFATVLIDQVGDSSSREPDLRPLFERIAGFEGRTNHTIGDELIEATSPTPFRCRAWGDELGDHAPVCRDRDTLAGLN